MSSASLLVLTEAPEWARARIQRLEEVQAVLLEVSRIACLSPSLETFLRSIQQAIGRLMYSANFYVALYDPTDSSVRFVYYVDDCDASPDASVRFPLHDAHDSPTAWVILKNEALELTSVDASHMRWRHTAWDRGADAEHWMGAPLRNSRGEVAGAVVIQSYRSEHVYTRDDAVIFTQIADHVSVVLEKFAAGQSLEQAVDERTTQLKAEVEERKKGQALQEGLYQIAALCASDSSIQEVYRAVHEVTARLLYARNFFILLHHHEEHEYSLPYFVDEVDEVWSPVERFPVWNGPTAFVVRTRQPQLIDPERAEALVRAGEISDGRGPRSQSTWMGAPMIVAEHVYGVIVVQSYDPCIRHSADDLALLAYVANHVAGALARRNSALQVREAAEQLRRRNDELSAALEELRATQAELIQREKLASLGGLVAGIAHEINTPLGICVTATSHIQDKVKGWRERHANGQLTAECIDTLFGELDMAMKILETNTRRGAELVRSFKNVAVDQTSGRRRAFDLGECLREIVLSLKPAIAQSKCAVEVRCDAGISADGFPGALSQIVTNLLMNAFMHGFEESQPGRVVIQGHADGDNAVITVEDNGRGMPEADLSRLFEPFFTTRRGRGGTGLGAHIAYNQATSVLRGSIRAQNHPSGGLRVTLRFPRCTPERE